MNINIGEIVNNKMKEMEENKVIEKLIEETVEKKCYKSYNRCNRWMDYKKNNRKESRRWSKQFGK